MNPMHVTLFSSQKVGMTQLKCALDDEAGRGIEDSMAMMHLTF